jgi:hypothetical protein
MDKNQRLFYLRDANKRPIAAVATELKTSDVVFAVATHNPIDPFDRKRGREIAFNRIQSRKGVFNVPTGTGVKRRVIEKIAETDLYPQRTREAAKLWLDTHPPLQ